MANSILLTGLLCLLLGPAVVAGEFPFADVHVHYKWSQEEVTSPQEAIDILEKQDIELAVVIGTPAELALRLQELAPDIVIPIWSPYRTSGDWSTWAFDKGVLTRARAALADGSYRGIGELHLIGGFAPDSDSPVINGLARIAAEFDVPLLIHTETSRPNYMLKLCMAHPQTRMIWAHSGSILSPRQVAQVLESCDNVWAELAARDPWRFINNPITDQNRRLLPEWRELVEAYPERFLLGSDPVWPVDNLDSWDEADTGWQQYDRFIDFHRQWTAWLPATLAAKLRYLNARQLFSRADR